MNFLILFLLNCWKHSSIILLFFKDIFIYKLINSTQKYSHTIDSYDCFMQIFYLISLLSITFYLPVCIYYLFWNIFNTETIKSNPMTSNVIIFIKIYFICLILFMPHTFVNHILKILNWCSPSWFSWILKLDKQWGHIKKFHQL